MRKPSIDPNALTKLLEGKMSDDSVDIVKRLCESGKCDYNTANDLLPSETERLAKLAEEAAEVVVAIMKIIRHGYESHGYHNRGDLHKEIGHLKAVVTMMVNAGDLDEKILEIDEKNHIVKMGDYLHYRENLEALDSDG